MRRILTMLFVSVFMLSLCPLHAQETETLVLIDTDMGNAGAAGGHDDDVVDADYKEV